MVGWEWAYNVPALCGLTSLDRDLPLIFPLEVGKNTENTVAVIDEVAADNWGIGGESVTVRRARTTPP